MRWFGAKLGKLVYGASDIDLCEIIGSTGSECSKTVFENSHYAAQVVGGVLREESIALLKEYFKNNEKN